MYRANCVFAPYRHIRKISVFGSARIRNDEPAYETAREFARKIYSISLNAFIVVKSHAVERPVGRVSV